MSETSAGGRVVDANKLQYVRLIANRLLREQQQLVAKLP